MEGIGKYHDTTGLCGAELKKAIGDANKGDKKVLGILSQFDKKPMSASMIQLVMVRQKKVKIDISTNDIRLPELYQIKRVLGSTDSIKRSLNTLWNAKLIDRQEERIKGAFGQPEYSYLIKKSVLEELINNKHKQHD